MISERKIYEPKTSGLMSSERRTYEPTTCEPATYALMTDARKSVSFRWISVHSTYVPIYERSTCVRLTFFPVSHHEMIFLRPCLFSMLEVSAVG